jgi:hypothetical protein
MYRVTACVRQPVAIPRQAGRYQIQAPTLSTIAPLPRDAGLAAAVDGADGCRVVAARCPRPCAASRPERGAGGQRASVLRLVTASPSPTLPALASHQRGDPISTAQEGRPRVMEALRDQRVRRVRLCWLRKCRTSAG